MTLPRMLRVQQQFDPAALDDPPAHLARGLAALALETRATPGQTVAVACSSRGIKNYPAIVKTTLEALRRIGLKPFLFPAMGSHGSGTAAGQRRVLEHYGITAEAMGAPIRSSLDVVRIAVTADGVPVYVDRSANDADHIVLINRIKQHTEFEHEFESGLLKMMAIGLGKQKGAAVYHKAMMTYGYGHILETVAREVLRQGKILFGVAVVENGYGRTAAIEALPPGRIAEDERRLFALARRLAPRLPFDEADIIVIDEMGKDISGTGFDTKVVGRIGLPLVTRDPETPRIKRILVCDLTEGSGGNAVGVGIADFITRRLRDKIDIPALAMNTITAACPEMGKIPLALADDREAVTVALDSLGLIPPAEVKLIRIRNTSRLTTVDVSEAYAAELARRPELTVVTPAHPMTFNARGNLPPF